MVAYEELLPDSPEPGAPKDEWIDYLRDAHGDIEDAKASLIFTDEPPTSTFT